MVTATLTSKGQLTIPKVIRDTLHLHAGDRVAFVLSGDDGTFLKPITKSVDDVFGKLHRPGQPCRSLDEMKAAVAGRMKKAYR